MYCTHEQKVRSLWLVCAGISEVLKEEFHLPDLMEKIETIKYYFYLAYSFQRKPHFHYKAAIGIRVAVKAHYCYSHDQGPVPYFSHRRLLIGMLWMAQPTPTIDCDNVISTLILIRGLAHGTIPQREDKYEIH
ncbi:hypothetical protein ACJX0J_020617 [Zea mays]